MERQLCQLLVVDDEPDMCWMIENALRMLNCTVRGVTHATQALELLATEPCAVALVDAKLPDMDGPELATVIRRQFPDTQVVLISGYYDSEDNAVVEGLHKNLFAGFITKPFDIEEIRQVVRRAIERSQNR